MTPADLVPLFWVITLGLVVWLGATVWDMYSDRKQRKRVRDIMKGYKK